MSDGYGNARVHKYSPDGKLLFSWGESGTEPGQFNIAHNICTDKDGWVYVADRENHRIQVFDSNGRFETQWVNMARPCGLYIDQEAELVYVGELGVSIGANAQALGVGPRVSIYDTRGKPAGTVGQPARGRRAGTVHRAPWDLHRLPRGHLRRGGILDPYRRPSGPAQGTAFPPEAGPEGLIRASQTRRQNQFLII